MSSPGRQHQREVEDVSLADAHEATELPAETEEWRFPTSTLRSLYTRSFLTSGLVFEQQIVPPPSTPPRLNQREDLSPAASTSSRRSSSQHRGSSGSLPRTVPHPPRGGQTGYYAASHKRLHSLLSSPGASSTSPTSSLAASSPGSLDRPRLNSSSSAAFSDSSYRTSSTTSVRTYIHNASPGAVPYPAVRVLPMHQKKRILVSGGAGFIGSFLVDRLMLMGHSVLVIDNYFTGTKENLSVWRGHPNFELVRHDVVEPIMVEIDQLYHLACPAAPIHYQSNQIKTIKTAFMGTLHLLGLAKRTKARFLLASTSEVYGDPTVHPQPETYFGNVNPTGPRACYDEGKRVAETLTYGYMYQDGVDVRVARIFNTFGPRMHPEDGRVVSNFVLQVLRDEPITIHGDGAQTRSFMYVDDCVDGLIALMNREPETPRDGRDDPASVEQLESADVHSPVNLGRPQEFTIRQLVDVVAEVVREVRLEYTSALSDSEGEDGALSPNLSESQGPLDERSPQAQHQADEGPQLIHLPMPVDDPRQRCPDITRAKQLLGWEPRWALKDGLREMVRYYLARMDDGSLQ